MRSLWFKKCYVDLILSGEKTTTIRAKKPRYVEGDTVNLSVGPMRPFAVARIVSIGKIAFRSLDARTREGVRTIYGDCTAVWRIRFEVVN